MTPTPYPSRGLAAPLAALLAGGMSALVLNFALSHADTVLVFLSYLTALPIFLVGLGTGGAHVLIAMVFGAVVLLLSANVTVTLIYAFLFALPAAGLSLLALRYRQNDQGQIFWYPEGKLLVGLTLYACALFMAIAALAAGQEGGLLGITMHLLNEALPQITAQQTPEIAAQITAAIPQLAKILPALVGSSWIFLILISFMLAQVILRQQNWQIRPTFELQSLVIPQWLILTAAVTGIAAFVAPTDYAYLASNLCMILCLPFFFVGLAVVHVFANTRKTPLWILAPFYIVLTVVPHLGIFVALLGALDQGLQLRQKLQQASA